MLERVRGTLRDMGWGDALKSRILGVLSGVLR